MDDFQIEPLDTASAPDDSEVEVVETDTSTEETEQEEKVVFDDRQQAVFNNALGGKVAKQRIAEHRADEAERKLEALQAQQPKEVVPDIPDAPNPDDFYDDQVGFNEKIKERDAAIEKRAEFNTQQKLIESQQAYNTQQLQQAEAKKQQETFEGYAKSAKSFGIENDQMIKDANAVANGLNPDVSDYIAEDAQGPLVTSYLANNIMELETIRSMTPTQAAVYIATEVKPKLAGMRKATNAPKPADVVGGKGAPTGEDPLLDGVTFE